MSREKHFVVIELDDDLFYMIMNEVREHTAKHPTLPITAAAVARVLLRKALRLDKK